MPSPIIATIRPSSFDDAHPVGFPRGREFGLDLLDVDFLRDRAAGEGRSPVSIVKSLRPRCFNSCKTSCASRRILSRCADHPDDPSVDRDQQRGLSRVVKTFDRREHVRTGAESLFANQAEVADDDLAARPPSFKVATTPCAGLRLERADVRPIEAAPIRFGDNQTR